MLYECILIVITDLIYGVDSSVQQKQPVGTITSGLKSTSRYGLNTHYTHTQTYIHTDILTQTYLISQIELLYILHNSNYQHDPACTTNQNSTV